VACCHDIGGREQSEAALTFAQQMMDAEVEKLCGAGYGEVSPARVNSRNGYRPGSGTPGREPSS
jgi:transposase-like protein